MAEFREPEPCAACYFGARKVRGQTLCIDHYRSEHEIPRDEKRRRMAAWAIIGSDGPVRPQHWLEWQRALYERVEGVLLFWETHYEQYPVLAGGGLEKKGK